MKVTAADLPRMCGGTSLRQSTTEQTISEVLIDSRQLVDPVNTVFFALPGLRQDGHSYIEDCYQRGVRHFVIAKRTSALDTCLEATFVQVADVKVALQRFATAWRKQHQLEVLGITGSNGKTTIKDWLQYLLADRLNLCTNPKSYNSQIGVPLSVLTLEADDELAIFEAGISKVSEMDALREVIRPTIGMIANLGSAHDEGFSSRTEKLNEKLKLFSNCNLTIYCLDHLDIHEALQHSDHPTLSWSTQSNLADIYFVVTPNGDQVNVEFSTDEDTVQCALKKTDAASIENALHCLAVLSHLDLLDKEILERFPSLPTLSMRQEMMEGTNGCMIINDGYSADLESLRVAMSTAHRYPAMKKTLILSDFKQIGPMDDMLPDIAQMIRAFGFVRVIGIGKAIQHLEVHLEQEVHFQSFASTESILEQFDLLKFQDELIILKGARSFRLERIADQLRNQSHGAILEIDLSALASNLKCFERFLDPGTKVMAMVKAAAYGSGPVQIARYLSGRNVDYLAVAYIDEGVELRMGGIDLPILVLNPGTEHWSLLFQQNLEPEVYSLRMLQKLEKMASQRRVTLPVHLKIETGMTRLGFKPEEVTQAVQTINQSSWLSLASVFSHLAASDDQAEDEFTESQLRRFARTVEQVKASSQDVPLAHILNSNGIVRFSDHQHDMVRIGIGMYGIGVKLEGLERVHRLTCEVAQIHEVPAGTSIGYNRGEITHAHRRIATIGIGYADGLIRKTGNRRYSVLVNECRAPIVGNVCMDMTMIDVTGIDHVEVGSRVELFGPHLPIEELAEAADTIPYEVFTSISTRVRRVYAQA